MERAGWHEEGCHSWAPSWDSRFRDSGSKASNLCCNKPSRRFRGGLEPESVAHRALGFEQLLLCPGPTQLAPQPSSLPLPWLPWDLCLPRALCSGPARPESRPRGKWPVGAAPPLSPCCWPPSWSGVINLQSAGAASQTVALPVMSPMDSGVDTDGATHLF